MLNRLRSIFRSFESRLRRLDGRLFLITNNLSMLVFGVEFLDLQRSYTQICFAFSLAFTLECIFQVFVKKSNWRTRPGSFLIDRLTSSTTMCLGFLLALNIPDFRWYALPVVLGVMSKMFILNSKGNHIYNPSNFAIVATLILLPDELVYFLPDQFAASSYPIFQALVIGLLVNLLVNRLTQMFTYLVVSALTGFVISQLTSFNFVLLVGPDYSALAMIYLMFMISDPKTSPSGVREQVLYGSCIAIITVFLRWYGSIAHQIVALFITLSLFHIFREINWISKAYFNSKRAQVSN